VNVYVAAPYDDGAIVREMVHPMLRRRGITPTSRWAESATGPEDFSRFTAPALRALAIQNRADLNAADVCFLFDPHGRGRETYLEGGLALEWGRPVVWYSRRGISRFMSGAIIVDSVDDALTALKTMRAQHAEGIRGLLLARAAVSP
jgi:hypothetical protein